jgi:hypothetical protein
VYLNVDDQLGFHPKAIAAGNAAMGLWVRCGSWAAGYPVDGRIPTDIAKAAGKPAEIAALVRTGWWEPIDGGYQMHDYQDHNMTAAEAIALSEKRAAAGRKGGSKRPGLSSIKGQAHA